MFVLWNGGHDVKWDFATQSGVDSQNQPRQHTYKKVYDASGAPFPEHYMRNSVKKK